MKKKIAIMPSDAVEISASCFRAQSLSRNNPTASPTNAKALQGKMGNNQDCGSLRLCTPLTYDSSGQGSQRGRQLVHTNGASKETIAATPTAIKPNNRRGWLVRLSDKTIQQPSPISIMEIPIAFRMSTRSRSLHGAQ